MSFFLVQVIVGGLLLGAVYALFSSGLTLVWGMMNIVNFAHGDFVMLGMYVAFVVFSVFGVGPAARRAARRARARDLGVIVYFALIRHIMKGPMLAQILGTFGLALLLRYSVFWWFGANFLSLPKISSAAHSIFAACASRPRGCSRASSRCWSRSACICC